ncbi:MAG: hypothetical protein EA352_05040 [Gemmatimonadales bacterium]|nr:MAG: hypothetical protein EA352_05040 [Gemmatimonadales bacterium]
MTPELTTELLRAAAVGAAFLAIFGLAELWRGFGPPPEWTRKFVHVAGGLVAASLPWVLDHHWTVLGLGLALGGLLWWTRRMGWLQSVHGVERTTEGGLHFPLAIYLLFLLAAHEPVFYLVSVLVLVVADTAAAILGSAYGRATYEVEEDRRSLEGSTVFFLMAFLSIHLPLLLLTELDRGAVVLISVQLALLVTFFEAISVRGIDNLVVPLGTLYLLVKLTPQDAAAIGAQLAAQLVIIAVIALVAWRFRFLRMSGALALMLFMYGAWSLGGPAWVVAPVVAMLAFAGFRGWLQDTAAAPDARYQVLALFHVAIVAGLLFIANNTFRTLVQVPERWAALGDGDPFYPLYVGAVAAHLALLGWVLMDRAALAGWKRRRLVGGAFVGTLLVVVPAGILAGVLLPGAEGARGAQVWIHAGVGSVIPLVSVALFAGFRRWLGMGPHGTGAPGLQVLRAQTASVGMATLLVLGVHFWRLGLL